ncbi:MAG: hypothetical protein ABI068_17870 [Ktedonobacterales bacterium]
MRDPQQLIQMFRQVVQIARDDPDAAQQVREAIIESELLSVFGANDTLDPVELLDLGGEPTLRLRLREMALADLKALVARLDYDPEKESARWRSTAKFIDLIVTKAQKQLAEEEAAALAQPAPLAAASWLL